VKWKVALLLVAVGCSSALVVSAQTFSTGRSSGVARTPQRNSDPLVRPRTDNFGFTTFYGASDRLSYSVSTGQSQEETQLANQANELAQKLVGAKSDADREKHKEQLSEILDKQFEVRQQRHKKEIESLEAQVKKLRDLVDKRQENRRQIVAKRLDQILQEAQGLGW
jgi:hypothetical protein